MVWLQALLGLIVLLVAGDLLVRGAVNFSLRIKIPAFIVSLTVVALGTSAPELLVAIRAILDNSPGIALGNVVGSNIANVFLVLGIPALIAGINTRECNTRKNYVFMMTATVIFLSLAFIGNFSLPQGILFLILLFLFLLITARDTLKMQDKISNLEVENADPNLVFWKIILFLSIGFIGLPIGADILVKNASLIAKSYGLSDEVIGLTLVALGTSLPELATTLMAALRKQADVALGNVIGSNIFNLFAIVGITTMFGDIPIASSFLNFDFWIMFGAGIVLFPFVYMRVNINRLWGAFLTLTYAAYLYLTVQ
ncbi:MAG: calcium/sodium antiporter [Paracoccaceae bacterium]|nr:calcium/sodium antiporter [Paracoccaceae bacterium]|tara:strand:+ start:72 stop:1007 length:936 start_codon:yes stop_codon:yes gene_type:complete